MRLCKRAQEKVIDFILLLLEDIDKEIKDMKLNLNTRLRAATVAYMQQLDLSQAKPA